MLPTKERIIIMEPPQKQVINTQPSLPVYVEDHFKKVDLKKDLTATQRKELVMKLIDFVEAF